MADATVIDTTSAKIGVNVSPEELKSLPVNGRNFANLMTLATGATTDGNGGWASVRFNGKSNQQNYLNYDGVDGSYVWDASPGYLNATGSQFRLQTSMESIAEFRVNSGLAPAESGLGAGGNITVISKSGSNRFNGSLVQLLPQRRARLGEQVRRQEAGARVQPVRRLARRPDRHQPDVLLRQLRGPEADDRSVASPRRCRAPRPFAGSRRANRSAAGRDRARRGRRRSRRCSPGSRRARWRPPTRCSRSRRSIPRRSRPSTPSRPASITASPTISRSTPACSTATATSTRRIAPSRRAACSPRSSRSTPSSITSRSSARSVINEVRVGYNRPRYDAIAFGTARLRPDAGLALGHGHLAVDRRPRHDRRGAQRPARPRHEQRLDQRTVLRPAFDRAERHDRRFRAARTPSRSAASTATSSRSSSSSAATRSPTPASTSSSTTVRRRSRSRSNRRSSRRSSTT